VRVRVANTDPGLLEVAVAGAPYRVLAVDGRDLEGPQATEGRAVRIPGGGRVDLGFQVPGDGAAVRVRLGADGTNALVVGPAGGDAPAVENGEPTLDLLSYGTSAPAGFDPARPDREFDYSIDRRPGFLDGRPGLWWTINGRLFPDVPMFVVASGDVVRMTISNHSGETHPMHLHGHHLLVLSRNGRRSTGSPWWVDSLDVSDGDTWEVAFVADNPGVWMDHCHNLPHAAQGLVAHVAYEGVTSPFLVGGPAGNHPE
jgi:FtsP/CotA-like multicopper oxidase with cupredoxin domain